MKVYVAHSREINYKKDLYQEIRKSEVLQKYEIILPHEKNENNFQGRAFYKTIDVLIAEVSERATGLGIELGWCYDDHKPIYCIYREGSKISSSIKAVTNHFYEYKNNKEMIEIIKNILNTEMEYKENR